MVSELFNGDLYLHRRSWAAKGGSVGDWLVEVGGVNPKIGVGGFTPPKVIHFNRVIHDFIGLSKP